MRFFCKSLIRERLTGKKVVYTTTVETLLFSFLRVCGLSGVYPSFQTYGVYPFPLFSQENGIHYSLALLCDTENHRFSQIHPFLLEICETTSTVTTSGSPPQSTTKPKDDNATCGSRKRKAAEHRALHYDDYDNSQREQRIGDDRKTRRLQRQEPSSW